MFGSLRNVVFQTLRNSNGGGGDHSTTHFLHFFLLQNPSLLFISSRSITSSINHNLSSSSFVVSYLMNSCGLSEDKAISVSKTINFETSSKPDSVLTLLENNGFTKPCISKLIIGRPQLLLANPDKTLKPKLEFFYSIGFSGLDLAMILSKNPNLLAASLAKHLIPTFDILKSFLHTDKNVVAALKQSTWVLSQNPEKRLVPNIGVLRDQGVSQSNISMLLNTQPRSLLTNPDRFKEIVERIKGMGFDPLQMAFASAVFMLTSMSNSTWEAKLNLYRKWDLSEDQIRTAFRKQPKVMTFSEKKITTVMDFYVNKIGYTSSFLAEHPNLLIYSLEKRIIPRCMVMRILESKGLVKNHFSLITLLSKTDKSFLEKYVVEYEEEVPELRKVYQGQLDCLKLPITSQSIDGMNMV